MLVRMMKDLGHVEQDEAPASAVNAFDRFVRSLFPAEVRYFFRGEALRHKELMLINMSVVALVLDSLVVAIGFNRQTFVRVIFYYWLLFTEEPLRYWAAQFAFGNRMLDGGPVTVSCCYVGA